MPSINSLEATLGTGTMKNVFGMVSTKSSERYTAPAVASFFAHTPADQIERFILIDNDGSLNAHDFQQFPKCEIQKLQAPRSFAANLNAVLAVAEECNADLFFLNNDLIFTPGWIEPLLIDRPAILSPLSNRERPYIHNTLRCDRVMDLNQYAGQEQSLHKIAQYHAARGGSYQAVLFLPFFCIKIPQSVYRLTGKLDESFGRGGAEDNDYCIRAYLQGFTVEYAPRSYVLHFSGKSTWDGAETAPESRAREQLYIQRFQEKWGDKLARLSIGFDHSTINENPTAHAAAQRGDLRSVIEALRV